MTDETAPPAPPTRRRPLRLGVVVALVAAAALVAAGGAVALAGDDGEDGGDQGTDHPSEHAAEHDAGSSARHGAGASGRGHRHEPLAPYEQRYADASADEQAAADALRADVRETLTAYEDADAAVAAGYRAPARPRGPMAHYLDPTAAQEGEVLDPARPTGLVYYTGGDGDPVLLGAFFVAPPGSEAPRPAGDLVVWHSHDPACAGFFATEDEPCTDSRRMLHVWTADQVEVVGRRTGEPVEVRVVDPFGAPFRASVART